VNTFSTEDRTRTYQNLERTQSRFESGDAQFERELPPEIRAELFRSRPRSPRMAGNRSHTAAGRVSPPQPLSDVPDAARAPKPTSERGRHPRRENNALGLLLGLLSVLVLIALLVPITTGLHQFGGGTQFPYALPQPPVVEVRRALPAVPRATLVERTTSGITDPAIGQWYSVRFANGAVMQIRYGGRLTSTAFLPGAGEFVGDARVINNHYWIWMQSAGASFPSWVDP
jgi:hypothetical protein